MSRNPAVAGQFYTSNADKLRKEVEEYLGTGSKRIDALGCVSPHAGYMYSGAVAGSVLSSISPRKSYIILGPNHTGMGAQYGLDDRISWLTPLGQAVIDSELGEGILAVSSLITKDNLCHDFEHSIEVQLPFLQVLDKNFRFVPIIVSSGSISEYLEIGKNLADAIRNTGKDVTIIASSDMTHYETHESAKKKDRIAIDKILALDIEGFLKEVSKNKISMCGYVPTAIMMAACKSLGAKKATLVKYQTSGDVSGDYSAVVGYAGIIVF